MSIINECVFTAVFYYALSEIEVPRISNYTAEEFSPAAASLLEKNIRKCLVNSKNDVEAQRKNPSSPLYSVKTCEEFNLKADLLKGVYAMGFNTPSKIQEIALKTLLVEPPQNLIAQSQSGTGKTAAFVIAMLSRVDSSKNYPQVLCLSPTFEIAIQTGEVAANMAKFCTDIEIRFAVRGESFARGKTLTDHVIIGTPGKVLDWALKYKVFDIKKINVFVLDDANVMLATHGYQDQCIQVQKNLDHNRCQMMFFSTSYSEEAMNFAEVIVPKALIIRLKKEEEILDNIKQYYVKCLNETDKYNVITNIYSTVSIGQAIIFCQTRKTASWLSEKMTKDGHYVALISGELSVEDRIQVLDRYRTGLEKVLITTNVFSRGIDLEEVTIVVNFDLPVLEGGADYETYLFRIGCTGRFGQKGIVLNLIDSAESEKICHSIEDHFSMKMSYLNGEDYEEIEKIGS